MNKEQISAITMSVTISFFVVVTMLQQNIQAYLYSPPPPGSDYNQYKAGWDTAQADAYYDAGNGKYRDYLSGADCQGHTQAYCHGYMAGYQQYVDRNSHHLVDQQDIADNNANIRIELNV